MVTNKLLTHGRFCVHPSHGEGSGVCGSILSRALEGGDKVLLALLDQRFPDKDKTDELGEMFTEVFSFKVQTNETVKGWIGRASELFDRLKRKTHVDLPEEARGWLSLTDVD